MVRRMYQEICWKTSDQGWAYYDDTYHQYSVVYDDILPINTSDDGEDYFFVASPKDVLDFESPAKMEAAAANDVTKTMEFNEDGRPCRLKIIYQHVDKWTTKVLKLKFYQAKIIRQEEVDNLKKLNAEEKSGETFEPPRLIFVLQDKDFWPGSEMDPAAMRRRLSKKKECQVSTTSKRPGHEKMIFVYDKIVKSDGDFDYAITLDQRYF